LIGISAKRRITKVVHVETMSGETDKAAWEDKFEMEPEHDFSDGVPNPYAARFREDGEERADGAEGELGR
jgi:hypothetical protein